MLETGLPRLRMNRSVLQDLSRAVSRFSRGPVAGSHRQHFFDPTNTFEKVLAVISRVLDGYPSVHGVFFLIENPTVQFGAVLRKRESYGAVRCGFQTW